MRNLSDLVAEAQGQPQAEYLKDTLIGREEISRFAKALRNEVIDECVGHVNACWTNNREVIVSHLLDKKDPT